MKSWTVMMFMAGDNDLGQFGADTLLEVKSVGSTANVDFVAEFDAHDAGVPTKRYLLTKGTDLADDLSEELPETNTGDPSVLSAFAQWATDKCPSEHRMLTIWNHGSGWDDSNLFIDERRFAISARVRNKIETDGFVADLSSYEVRRIVRRNSRVVFRPTIDYQLRNAQIAEDVTSQDSLTTADLHDALAAARAPITATSAKAAPSKFDIIACDACYMAMIEVAYAIRDQGEYFVGTEYIFRSSSGWPYDQIGSRLTADPKMTPASLASAIVEEFTASYGAAERVHLSAVLLSQTPVVVAAINQLANALLARISDNAFASLLVDCYYNTTRYQTRQNRPDYADLGDFCNQLLSSMNEAAIVDACASTKQALADCVLVSKTSSAYDHSSGLSIYFPKDIVSPLYKDLAFSKDSTWLAFLAEFVKV